MKGFEFRLEKVLNLRAWREQESAARLGEARRRMDEAARAARLLREVRAGGREQIIRAHASGGPVGQLQNLNYVLGRLDAQIAEADAARLEAEQRVQDSLVDYAEALRERRVLERLKERRLEAERVRRAQVEDRVMDDIAVTRHARRAAGGAAGG